MNVKKLIVSLISGMVLSAFAAIPAMAQEEDPTKEQFIPMPPYLTGPFAAGGSGNSAGTIDYFNLLNMRDGGINGIKLVWEICDFGYNTERGVECYERLKGKGLNGALMVQPFSTGVTYALLERTLADKIPMTLIVESQNIVYISNKCIKQEYQRLFLKVNPVFPALKN